jgi:hypothetical protein
LAAGDLHETVLYLNEEGPRPPAVLTDVDSLFVVGDVHGEFERLPGLLGNAGLIDADGKWVGGERHVVFLGDIFDRGMEVTRVLWFLYELERQARAAGGGSHIVLGNHETMIFTEDIRYVTTKEQLIARLHGTSYSRMFDIRHSLPGRWLVGRPGVMKVNGVLLAHGGVAPRSSPRSIETVNDSIRTFMLEDLFYLWGDTTMALVTDSATAEHVADQYSSVIVMDPPAVARRTRILFGDTGILWFRGYVESDTLASALNDVLEEFGAEIHVVAHTLLSTITARYDGKLLTVDIERPATKVAPRVGRRGRSLPAMEGHSRRSSGAVLTKAGADHFRSTPF